MGATIKEPINLNDLMGAGVTLTIEANQDKEDDEQEIAEYEENLLRYLNKDILDEEEYSEGQPFATLASKMFNLLDDKIKKRILRDGYADPPKKRSLVRVHYNAYIECDAEPFDSTYARKQPHQFVVDEGQVIVGLDVAVQSMKLNEKSQFLICPGYAYGRFGCLNRVPADAEVLFEIELLEIVDTGAAMTFETLSSDDKKQFIHVYEYCQALCAKGKDVFKKSAWEATKIYNRAASLLEYAQLADETEEEKQQDLLMKLYTNLIVCYTKLEQPQKSCMNFNKLSQMVKGTDRQISSKCFYNNSKCLRMLGDYELAQRRLEIAHRLEPKNPEILKEFVTLNEQKEEYKKKEKDLAKALIKSGT